MKKILCLVLALLFSAGSACAASEVGVLSIPSACISVALFDSAEQDVVDESNSAAFFWSGSWIIADHNNQAFKSLKDVAVGEVATIYHADGSRIRLVCVDKYNGKNTGHELVDANGRNVMADHAYLMYTCRIKGFGARHIIITQWEEYE